MTTTETPKVVVDLASIDNVGHLVELAALLKRARVVNRLLGVHVPLDNYLLSATLAVLKAQHYEAVVLLADYDVADEKTFA